MSREMEDCLMQLFDAFSEGGSVDLRKIKQHFNRNAQQTCSIFISQLQAVPHNYMNRQEFIEYFTPTTNEPSHVQAVFEAIDINRSGRITKAQVRDFFAKFGPLLSQAQLGIMMDGYSNDGALTLVDLQKIMRSN